MRWIFTTEGLNALDVYKGLCGSIDLPMILVSGVAVVLALLLIRPPQSWRIALALSGARVSGAPVSLLLFFWQPITCSVTVSTDLSQVSVLCGTPVSPSVWDGSDASQAGHVVKKV